MEANKIESYDLKGRLLSPVFICWFLLPYYAGFENILVKKLDFSRPWYFTWDALMMWEYWKILIPHLLVDFIFIAILFHLSIKIEKSINEPFEKFLSVISAIVITVLIIGSAASFGNVSNSEIVTKLGWCWVITLVLLVTKMFGKQKDAV